MPETAVDIAAISADGEWARRRLILEQLLIFSLGRTFEFEERDLYRPCVGHVSNNFTCQEPTGDKEFVIRVRRHTTP